MIAMRSNSMTCIVQWNVLNYRSLQLESENYERVMLLCNK